MTSLRTALVALSAALCLAATTATATATAPLPRLAIEPSGVTVSGVSSGGYMAGQFHLSHSRLVGGIGVFAAGPWFCARGLLSRAMGECLDRDGSAPGADELLRLAGQAAAAGRLDPLESLATARVWVFRGARDETVARPVTDALVGFYRARVPEANLRYVGDVAVGHGVPTENAGAECGTTRPPYFYACRYDGAGEMLRFLYGDPPAEPAGPGALLRFDQAPYDPTRSLAAHGYLYVPQGCDARRPCRLHVAFHGCRQGDEFVGERFVRETGYDQWAAAHRLVVLYPQAERSWLRPFNPQGCWDWWGYTGPDYATRSGRQVAAVRAMVRALAGF